MAPLRCEPVTADRWDDLVALFGPSGAYSGCWCTWWRLGSADWSAAGTDGRRTVMHDVVREGPPPGLLAYRDDVPVGWVAAAPRDCYPRLNRSPHTRAVDDVAVWAVTCFWVHRGHRRSGVAAALLDAACRAAADAGAPAVEGVPVDTSGGRASAADVFTGTVPLFARAGFVEVARRPGARRVVMRKDLRS